MKSLQTLSGIGAIAVLTIAAGCSSWNLDRMGQNDRSTTVASNTGTPTTRDKTNSAGADTSGQVALGSQPGSTNPPSSSNPQSASSSTPAYRTPQPYVSGSGSPASTASSSTNPSPSSRSDMNASTNAASAGASASTPAMAANANNAAEGTQRSASANPYSSNTGASTTSQASTQDTTSNNQAVVRSAQQALNERGYSVGTVDGIMGPHTQAAIKKFQSAKGLQATGQLDSATIAALGVTQPYSSSTTGMNTSTPERVSASSTTTPSTN